MNLPDYEISKWIDDAVRNYIKSPVYMVYTPKRIKTDLMLRITSFP